MNTDNLRRRYAFFSWKVLKGRVAQAEVLGHGKVKAWVGQQRVAGSGSGRRGQARAARNNPGARKRMDRRSPCQVRSTR